MFVMSVKTTAAALMGAATLTTCHPAPAADRISGVFHVVHRTTERTAYSITEPSPKELRQELDDLYGFALLIDVGGVYREVYAVTRRGAVLLKEEFNPDGSVRFAREVLL